jgi:transposase InsO family protein
VTAQCRRKSYTAASLSGTSSHSSARLHRQGNRLGSGDRKRAGESEVSRADHGEATVWGAGARRLLPADFTYVRMASGCFAYIAFEIDAFANGIVGWVCATSKQTSFVETAIQQAEDLRAREARISIEPAIHHLNAGCNIRRCAFGETLFRQWFLPSIGSVGDAYDNALAETVIGLYKHECVRATYRSTRPTRPTI